MSTGIEMEMNNFMTSIIATIVVMKHQVVRSYIPKVMYLNFSHINCVQYVPLYIHCV